MLSPPSLYVRPSRIAERQRPARSYTGLLVFLELQAGKRERTHDRGVHLSAHGDHLDSARESQAQRQWIIDLGDPAELDAGEIIAPVQHVLDLAERRLCAAQVAVGACDQSGRASGGEIECR